MGGDTMGMNNMINGAESTHIKDSKGAPPHCCHLGPYLSASAKHGMCQSLSEGLPSPCLLLVTGANRDQLAVAQCG